MIIRAQEGSLLFITQPDHAAAAADLVTHFEGFAAHPRRNDIQLAVREHDAGWRELDDELVFDEATGRALDFVGAPDPLKQSVWPRAIDRLSERDPYAAALIAEHAVYVYGANRGKAEWLSFFANLEARRTQLLSRMGITLETLQADYPFLGVADLLSLSFCHGWTEPRERFGRVIRCEGGAVTMAPSLLVGAPIPVRVAARGVADRTYESREALRTAIAQAPVEFLAGVARAAS